MDAEIEKETDKGFGVTVFDNNGVKHKIGVLYDGQINGHLQDGYPDDADKRSDEGNEHVNQSRRFARYYVYAERGYDTVEHAENPDYVNAVREAIAALSQSTFQQYFGALYDQLRSHYDGSAKRLVDIPDAAQADDAVVYELDVYLGVDLAASDLAQEARAIATARDLDIDDAMTSQDPSEICQGDIDDWRDLGEELLGDADVDQVDLTVSAVSGIHVGYPNARGKHEVQRADDPFEREPDATIELMPLDPGSPAEFRDYLDHHLQCQVRDCFAGMGLYPPEPFRVVGFGKFIYARRYDKYDMYPKFHLNDDQENTLVR